MMIAEMPLPYGSRRENKPHKIVVHAMAEYIEMGSRDFSARELLAKLGLSAHALITPSGVVIRCRDDDERAYHAKGHNPNSLGVEFLVPGVHTYASFLEEMKIDYLGAEQYDAGVELLQGWVKAHNIPRHAIFRHSHLSPGRKFDPGIGFPWDAFITDVYA